MSIVDNAVHLNGSRCAVPSSLDVTFETMAETGGVGWIGLYRPSPGEVKAVAAEFDLHPLVLEDTIAAAEVRRRMEAAPARSSASARRPSCTRCWTRWSTSTSRW